MRLNYLKSPTFFIAAPIILAVCLLQTARVAVFERLEWITYDWRVRLAHHYPGPFVQDATNLGLIEISDDTIADVNSGDLGFKFGLYWPREVYGRALHELTRQEAKAVAFDIMFAELRGDHPPVRLADGSTISSDRYFARQLSESGNVILGADEDLLPAPLFRKAAWKVGGIGTTRDPDGVLRRARAYEDYTVWHPVIVSMDKQLALNLGKSSVQSNQIIFTRKNGETFALPRDADGMIATSNIDNSGQAGLPDKFTPFTCLRVWNMGIVLAARELGLDLDRAEIAPGKIILRGSNNVTRAIPVDKDGYFYIDWSLTLNDPHVTQGGFEDLLSAPFERAKGNPAPNIWSNKLVVIGSTATGNELSDMGSTPLESSTFFITTHLNVANSVITNRFIHPTPLALDLALIILVGSISAWITRVMPRPATAPLLMLVFGAVYVGVCVILYIQSRLWAPIILPVGCAGFLTNLSVMTYRVRVEQSEKKRVKQLFSRLVSPDVVNEVLGAPTLKLGGVRREITIYFADVRGFTELTDLTQEQAAEFVKKNKLSDQEAETYFDAQARETLATISLYLATIADIVKQHKGLLDKYIGDCVMAFWGAPVPNPQHAVDAVRAAVEAQQALAALNQQRSAQNQRNEAENIERLRMGLAPHPLLPVLSMGSGINTGQAVVGYMGSKVHLLNYTAFGREVNLASRLEGVSGHGRILIGEGTFAALQRDDAALAGKCLEWAPRTVKGFRNAVRIYEVLWQPTVTMPAPPGENTNIRIIKPAPA